MSTRVHFDERALIVRAYQVQRGGQQRVDPPVVPCQRGLIGARLSSDTT